MINRKLQVLSIRLILIFLVLPIAGCLQKNDEINQEKAPENLTQIQTDSNKSQEKQAKNSRSVTSEKTVDKIKPEFTCSPQQLHQGDALKISMKPPHGGYLEIITPTKEYVFISELDGYDLVEESKKAGANPFYGASEFAELDQLKINTAEATTVDVERDKVSGKYRLKKIFSVSGKYKILLSKDSFETDDPTITGQCEVYYTNINQQQ